MQTSEGQIILLEDKQISSPFASTALRAIVLQPERCRPNDYFLRPPHASQEQDGPTPLCSDRQPPPGTPNPLTTLRTSSQLIHLALYPNGPSHCSTSPPPGSQV
jgi:hypothetical protein